jgi:hypothetical protein
MLVHFLDESFPGDKEKGEPPYNKFVFKNVCTTGKLILGDETEVIYSTPGDVNTKSSIGLSATGWAFYRGFKPSEETLIMLFHDYIKLAHNDDHINNMSSDGVWKNIKAFYEGFRIAFPRGEPGYRNIAIETSRFCDILYGS